jgi:predicted ATP-dependent protease
MNAPLAADAIRRVLPPSALGFDTTADVEPTDGLAHQPRVQAALDLAIAERAPGYNVFATGAAGIGKLEALVEELRRRGASQPPPPDWVYLLDFAAPRRPAAVALPTGRAPALAADVAALVAEARQGIRQAFESESHGRRHAELHERIALRRAQAVRPLQAAGRERDLAVELTPVGLVSTPLVDGKPIDPATFEHLPPDRRLAYQAALAELEQQAAETIAKVRAIERDEREQHIELDRDTALFAIGHLIEDAKRTWSQVARLRTWLDALREDLVAHVDELRADQPEPELARGMIGPHRADGRRAPALARYEVNVLVTHDADAGAPVVAVHDGSFFDLFGRIEYETAFGAALTDHRHIHAGAVHRAAGGYLVLPAETVLAMPYAWGRLKELLRTGQARMENPGSQYMLFPPASLDPEPVAAAPTVVLVGPPRLYRLLYELDEDVRRLFKVRADFDTEMPRDDAGLRAYTGLAAGVVAERALPPLDAAAVARVVEHGARLAEHRERLSARFPEIGDLVAEAGERAAAEGAPVTTAAHVDGAEAARRRLSDLPEQRLRELTVEGTLHVDVSGTATGQVNGLAVAEAGEHRFGHPVRITATAGPGHGRMVDIDREAELSGPVHTKGFLILAGLLRERFCRDAPLALHASIVFEQSYGAVEGDSASSGELFALLSALAGIPMDQRFAVTGSVDQHGAIQAVGGVNEKIEGFYDLCRERGLSGDQGVIVPAANLPHLMVRADVAEAVAASRFHVWAIATIEEGIELLAGVPAGHAGPDGSYPEESFHGHVQARLASFAAIAREQAAGTSLTADRAG